MKAPGPRVDESRRHDLELFAITAPGLEPIAAGELLRLGIEGRVERGGVAWAGPLRDLYEANLRLRSASRVVVTVTRFRARSFIELERHLRRVDWAPYLAAGAEVRLRVTSRKSRLYHERAIAERAEREVASRAGVTVSGSIAGDLEAEELEERTEQQLLIIRFLRDECVIRVDSSGALLHRRGYRQEVAKAPLRETLAAAMLLGVGWTGNQPLIDPLCGSGTIPIEAALLARRIAPGLASADREPRSYAFQRWPLHRPELWDRVVTTARSEIEDAVAVQLRGSDRDAGAVQAARANALRAGVDKDIQFDTESLSGVHVPAGQGDGLVLTNPPYGHRVGEAAALRDLYAAIGKLMKTRMPAWTFGMLAADRGLERQTALELSTILETRNGGIPVRLVVTSPADRRGSDSKTVPRRSE
jgi:putative N6-adenine-specific DNA methylase